MQKQFAVAFDLDDTLIPAQKTKWYYKLFRKEPLRKGTFEILDYCRNNDFKIWIYTASVRPAWYIRILFWRYGYQLDGIVNRQIHWLKVKTPSQKYPPRFDIDILIDDLEAIYLEGKRLNYHVIRVIPDDKNWVTFIKQNLEQYFAEWQQNEY